jgi:hypothetical protein
MWPGAFAEKGIDPLGLGCYFPDPQCALSTVADHLAYGLGVEGRDPDFPSPHLPYDMNLKQTRLAFPTLLAIFLLLGATAPAQAQLGISGGLNFESTDDIQSSDREATLENSTGYHVGLVYDLSLGPVNVRPGFFYRRVGEFEFSNISDQLQNPRYSVTAWEVPVDLRVTLLSAPLVSPYILGGPKATIPRGEDEFDEVMKGVSYTFNVGLGAQISLPGSSLRLQPELLYEFGATGFIDEDKEVELGDTNITFQPQESPKFSAFALRLNVIF